jgi:hypothetical protein
MISDDFVKFLSQIKFSILEEMDNEFELLKSYSKNRKNGIYEDKPFSKLKIIFPKGELGCYSKKEFCAEGDGIFNKLNLNFSNKLFFISLFGFSYYKEIPKNMINGLKSGFLKYINSITSSSKIYLVYPLTTLIFNEDPEDVKLKSFKIGKFEVDKFKDLIRKETGSDYYDIFVKETNLPEAKLSNMLSFSREISEIKIIDFSKLINIKAANLETIKHINEFYFDALSVELFKIFWMDFEKEQVVSLASGLTFLDPVFFRGLSLGDGIQVSVYHKINKEKKGWVVPIIPTTDSLTLLSQFDVKCLNKKSEKIFKALDIDSNFINILKQLVNFLAKGNYELDNFRYSEAVLNYWVGLDTILNNSDGADSNPLQNRVTSLLWYREQSSHKSVFFKIKQSYNKRSKYVHAGELANISDAVYLRKICQTILEILINVHTKYSNYKEYTYESWIAAIDELANLGRHTSDVPPDLLLKIGIVEE